MRRKSGNTDIPGFYTRGQAAKLFGVTPQRISIIAQRDGWNGHRVGPAWLYYREDVEQSLVRAQARKAWRGLGIPFQLWSEWWLFNIDKIDIFECPECGADAYSPAGNTKWSQSVACPACGWQNTAK